MPGPGHDIVSHFNPVSLEGMERVSLLDRTETKFIMPVNRLHELLAMANEHYRILEIDSSRVFSYYNIYYDTNAFLYYNQHVTGKLPRYKVRLRRYENSGLTYLEVKKKTNRGRTKKYRFFYPFPAENPLTEGALLFIREHTRNFNLSPRPVLINRFKRITLAGNRSAERVTIDYDISFSGMINNEKNLSYLSIIEIKKENASTASFFNSLLKLNMIHPARFSKYCMGNAMVNCPGKMNVLKSRFLMLKKIENEYYNAGCHT